MSILSEGKGVMMWLKKRGNNEQFSGYLLKLFNEQTNISFHKINFSSCDSKRFQRFTTWYGLQDISQLVKDWQVYKIEKQKKEEEDLRFYYKSCLHKLIMKYKELDKWDIYKKVKNNVSFSNFGDAYKKSKKLFDTQG
jgi:hypothetical protein